MAVKDQALLLYAGHLAQRPHSAGSIAAILRDYFGVPAEIVQFQGQWFPLEAENVTTLGQANSELGRTVVAGSSVFVSQSKFRVRPARSSWRSSSPSSPSARAGSPSPTSRGTWQDWSSTSTSSSSSGRRTSLPAPSTRNRRSPRCSGGRRGSPAKRPGKTPTKSSFRSIIEEIRLARGRQDEREPESR